MTIRTWRPSVAVRKPRVTRRRTVACGDPAVENHFDERSARSTTCDGQIEQFVFVVNKHSDSFIT
jgi:hypothetical protein